VKIKRTDATAPVWYVLADREEERTAIRVGLLEEKAPSALWRYVLAWGFGSHQAAADEMERLRPQVEGAVAMIESEEVVQCAQAVLGRLFLDEAKVSAHNAELRVLVQELTVLSGTLRSEQLTAFSVELRRWAADHQRLHERLLNTVQTACMLCGLAPRK